MDITTAKLSINFANGPSLNQVSIEFGRTTIL